MYQDLAPFRRELELPEDWEPDPLRLAAVIEHMARELSLDKDQEDRLLSILFGGE